MQVCASLTGAAAAAVQTLLAGLEGGQLPVGKQHAGDAAAADGALGSLSVRELRRRARLHVGN